MSIKKYCQQAKIISKARRKFPCISVAIISAAFAGLLISGDSLAAKDGDLGTSSSGSMNIRLTVPDNVQIHQLSDINAVLNQQDSISQANNKLQTVNACVYSTSGAYTLNAQNNNGLKNGNAMLRGNQNQLPYHLTVTDNNGSRHANVLKTAGKVQMRGATDPGCASGKNLHIKMQLANNAQLMPDQYSDVVNFTVSPV